MSPSWTEGTEAARPSVLRGHGHGRGRDEETLVYRIVGQDEVEGSEGVISWKSPVGKALLGKSVGDTVVVRWHAGVRELTVTAINYR